MREITERQRTRAANPRSTPQQSDVAHTRKAKDDRVAAVRRWIDDDDDSACRGID